MQASRETGTAPDLAMLRGRLRQEQRLLEKMQEALSRRKEEIERRLKVLDEVWTWDEEYSSLSSSNELDPLGLGAEDQEQSWDQLPPARNEDLQLLGLPLAEAVVSLRRREPTATKEQVAERLRAIGYPFRKGSVGRSIHAAWINANRVLHAASNGQERAGESARLE